jgi:type I pantothenate kinase
MTGSHSTVTPFQTFSRGEWSALRANTPLTLNDEELEQLRGLNDVISLDEVEQTYLPLSRYLALYLQAARSLGKAKGDFLGRGEARSPFVIAVAGSVAVGKSTFSRVLQALLQQWPERPRVALVTTDGFLFPNATLEEKGLMRRKGFPESYDVARLMQFLQRVKCGDEEVDAPVYSHLSYDIIPGRSQMVSSPEILIFEGLNVLETPRGASSVASDYFDFSIYLDAEENDISRWYRERFHSLQETAFQNPRSYFYKFRELSFEEAEATALSLWREINLPNLIENIQPTRQRADLILRKDSGHRIESISLRR